MTTCRIPKCGSSQASGVQLVWRPKPQRTISSYIAPRGMLLLRSGEEPSETLIQRRQKYEDFPVFRGIAYP